MIPQTIPANLYVELAPENIGQGDMLKELASEITEVAGKLMSRWEKQNARRGSATITLKIKMAPAESTDQHLAITHSIASALPPRVAMTLAKGVNGRLIVQPDGSSKENPDQLKLAFDSKGQVVARIDPQTGEVCEPPDVAGRVNTG